MKDFHGASDNSGSTGPKKALDDLENDTKANFQENIPVKVQFQGAMAPLAPFSPGGLFKFL